MLRGSRMYWSKNTSTRHALRSKPCQLWAPGFPDHFCKLHIYMKSKISETLLMFQIAVPEYVLQCLGVYTQIHFYMSCVFTSLMTWNSALNLLSRCIFRCPQWEPFGCSCGRLASRGVYQLSCVVCYRSCPAPFCLCFITFVIKNHRYHSQCPLWLPMIAMSSASAKLFYQNIYWHEALKPKKLRPNKLWQ